MSSLSTDHSALCHETDSASVGLVGKLTSFWSSELRSLLMPHIKVTSPSQALLSHEGDIVAPSADSRMPHLAHLAPNSGRKTVSLNPSSHALAGPSLPGTQIPNICHFLDKNTKCKPDSRETFPKTCSKILVSFDSGFLDRRYFGPHRL